MYCLILFLTDILKSCFGNRHISESESEIYFVHILFHYMYPVVFEGGFFHGNVNLMYEFTWISGKNLMEI